MQTTFHWQKGIFNCTYQILAGETTIGQLKDSEFSRTAYGNLQGKKIAFRSCGHLHPNAAIIDTEIGQTIGKITFNSWYPKAMIEYGDKRVYWKFSNLWETNWKIFNAQGIQVTSQGWSTRGKMKSSQPDELLILAGLFIANYYWRLAAVFIAFILPVVLFLF